MMICKACSGEFKSKRKDAIYCSASCRKRDSRGFNCDRNVTDNPIKCDNVTDNHVTDKISVTDNVTVVTDKSQIIIKCDKCDAKDLEIKKLTARIALLEMQVRKGIKSDPLPVGDDQESLRKRAIAYRLTGYRA